jgi:hypothetical protein
MVELELGAGPKVYTGIGSRQTPLGILALMRRAGADFARAGWTLRSGGADGADLAFEEGAMSTISASCEIYHPWPGFNGRQSRYSTPSLKAVQIASAVHPAWSQLSASGRSLHARNVHQVLGPLISAPVLPRCLICWTPDGASLASERSARTGGTGTAIVLASRYGVPVRNLQRTDQVQWLLRVLEQLNRQATIEQPDLMHLEKTEVQ